MAGKAGTNAGGSERGAEEDAAAGEIRLLALAGLELWGSRVTGFDAVEWGRYRATCRFGGGFVLLGNHPMNPNQKNMKNPHYMLPFMVCCCLLLPGAVRAQKKVSELTLVYDYSVVSAG